MSKLVLTERIVAAAKAESGRLELWDLRSPGLCLRVTDRGARTWIYRYRAQDGRHPRFTIGKFPAVSLRDARVRAMELTRDVALGGDPAMERRAARVEAKEAPKTFDDLADAYFDACEAGEWKPKGKRKKAAVLEGERKRVQLHVRPVFGSLPYADITRPQVKALLRGMQTKGIGAQTNLTQAIIRQIYNFAISDDLVQVNPATGFSPFADRLPRSRIWSDGEIQLLWRALEDPSGLIDRDGKPIRVGEEIRIAIKLLLLLGQRRGEVIGMERRELDLDARTWLIDAKRTKGSRPHMVPLPAAAVPLIRRAMLLSDFDREEPSAFVFSTCRKADTPIMPASVTHAMARLKEGLRIDGPTVHDLRRTVSTHLTSERCGVSPFIRSKVLGHIDAGGGAMVSAMHYDANTYLAEKRRALEAWERLLGVITEGSQPPRHRDEPREEGGDLTGGPRASADVKGAPD